MTPRIIKNEPYGDHRDAKSSKYADCKVDFEKVIYNLTEEDCAFILSVIHRNTWTPSSISVDKEVEKGDRFTICKQYDVMERGSERWAMVAMGDKEDKYSPQAFRLFYDIESKQIFIDTHADASAVIMIYEYFLNKQNNGN